MTDLIFKDIDDQLNKLSSGMTFMNPDALLMHEINFQQKIYLMFVILGLMMILLGGLL